MFKVKFVIFALIITVLGACSQQDEESSAKPIGSFEGVLLLVKTANELQFDCSTAAKRNLNTATEEGYNCHVEINEDTTIRTESGKILTVDELKKWEFSKLDNPKNAKVILSEEKDINTNKKSREELKTSEIIIFN